MSDRIEIPESRSAKWFLFIVCIGFVASGLLLISLNKQPITAALCILFFGFLSFKWFNMAMDPRSRITIYDNGIEDRNNGFGLIEWQDIERASIREVQKQSFINIRVYDDEKYLSRLSNTKRTVAKLNKALDFSSITISTVTLKVKPEELLDIINERIG